MIIVYQIETRQKSASRLFDGFKTRKEREKDINQ
jgi:hypothetical protein